ncbi:MAG TPA: phosphoenolpyruvate carboxylase, partial [Geminicoccaceae bacterium]
AAGSDAGGESPATGDGAAPLRLPELLDELRGRLDLDPFANPIRLLSLDLLSRVGPNGLPDEEVEALIQRLTLVAFRSRAATISAYAGENDPARNEAGVASLLRGQALDPESGEAVPFEAFAERVGRVAYGFVVTAHPTFGLAPELQDLLATLAFGEDGRPLSEAARRRVEQAAERLPHRPPRPLDLAAEHKQAMRVVRNMRAAIGRVRGVALDVAREIYPERWRELRPGLLGVASWVGYDTDGRSDIGWGTTIAKRLAVQVDQLGSYREQVAALRREAAAARETELATLLELLEARLALGLKSAADERELFAAGVGGAAEDPGWPQRVAKASREMAAAGSARLAGAGQLMELVERALLAARDDGIARSLCLLRAEVEAQGLTAARTHVRINAIQLQNAIRKTIGMDHAADDPAHRLTYLEAVARLADEAEPVAVNFGSLAAERTTAKRAFMVMAQMLKHFDASEPVRFLIAECESPFTLLTALYFAKLFGIAERIDISPLFETRKALERGASVVAEALSVASYRDYVRARGRICIQTGFSDAGRYMGQTAAAVMIERIRLDLAKVLADNDLADLELVIFDTHGESIGRGAHPGGFADRLRYYDTPESRRRFEKAGVHLREESSYQGGDGYLYFLNPTGAFAAVTRALEHVLARPAEAEAEDAFYRRRGYVDEFFAAVARFNGQVIDDPCYAAFLGFLGGNLLYKTGSRPVKRQT